eukprot:g30399.t1
MVPMYLWLLSFLNDVVGEKSDFLAQHGDSYGYGMQNFEAFVHRELGQRLKGDVYLDYAAAGLYTNTQIDAHAEDLKEQLYGNPHSLSSSAQRSSDSVEAAREAVLEFLGVPKTSSEPEYEVVFTRSCTDSLHLIADMFPWTANRSEYKYLLQNLGVTYTCEGFLEKNVDKPPDEAPDLLKASSLSVLQEIGTTIAEELAEATGGPGKKKAKTVSSGFRSSLASLVQKLNEADPHFIRCVKPNPEKVPDKFASTLAMEQLTCSGVFEAVRIRQSGFAARVPFGDFLGRYKIVVPKAKLKAILKALAPLGGCATGDLVLGKSKVFAKQPVMIRLDKARDMAVSTYAIDIQRVWRGYRTRKMLATCKVVFDQLKNWCAENDFYKTAGSTAVKKLKTADAILAEAAKVDEIFSKAEGLPLPVPRRKEVQKVKDRMQSEAKEIKHIKNITASINPVEIEEAFARAKDLEIMDLPEERLPMSQTRGNPVAGK